MASIHSINIGGTQYDVKSTHYATCSTAASTAAKVATVQNGTFTLDTGVRVSVKFTNANSKASATLNVNSTGAKTIRWRDANLASTQYWTANQIVDFIYDGTYWQVIGAIKDNNTTYTAATTSAAGLMSAEDKTKLDNISNISTDNFLNKTGDWMTGPLGLTLDIGYGQTLPANSLEGQVFFMEDATPNFPLGGSAGQILIKNSTADGDATWKNPSALGYYLPLSGGTVSGTITATKFIGPLQGNADTATSAINATNIYSSASTSKAYILGTTTASSANHSTVYNASVYTSGSVLYGAAWNDYAEYRICNEEFKAGQVVCENGDDTLSIATERLQPGANIVSDTFGFAIGETDEAKCPIAVSGRVLAYTYEPRNEFKAGDAVCAGPNGTVSRMTRGEIREYPERIIGTVSAIPNYYIWGAGQIKVDNRIWIKI